VIAGKLAADDLSPLAPLAPFEGPKISRSRMAASRIGGPARSTWRVCTTASSSTSAIRSSLTALFRGENALENALKLSKQTGHSLAVLYAFYAKYVPEAADASLRKPERK
jgi:hypothetical protein